MKTLYTHPAGFRPVEPDSECLYTVNPGIDLMTAINELTGILNSVNSILSRQFTDDAEVKAVLALVDYASITIKGIRGDGLTTSQLDLIGGALVDAINLVASRWRESNIYGVILLLQMSVGLTRSIVESCKAG